MKSLLWLVTLLSATGLLFAMTGTIAVATTQTSASLVNTTQEGFTVNYTVGSLSYQQVNNQQGDFTAISIDEYASTNRTGLPELPLLRQIIRVPLSAVVTPVLTNPITSTVDLASLGLNTRVLPRQESVSKNAEPGSTPFVINQEFYSGTNWSNDPTVKVEEIGMMRGARLVALDFSPVRYNPASGQLEVITSATVQVTYTGADWAATDELYQRYYSPAFESILAQSTFNYASERTSLNRYPLGLIIITPANYVTTLQPFVDWKIQEGYNVTVATTTTTGTTTTAIKAYLQNIWDNATTSNPAPTYLLLVGDTGQIPAYAGNTPGGHVTDLTYVRLQGTDFVPEMYYGRFSATTTSQLQSYIDKSMQYEMYTMPDPSYLSYTCLIGGVDYTYGPTHANGQINYGKNNYFGESTAPNWIPYGEYNIRNRMFLHPTSGNSEAAIIAAMNSGLGYINYTAHGDVTYWYDPNITIANVNSLTNANKYFVAVGNACLTNAFDSPECFGEAITRAANKGAVAYVGGTNSTYWDEDYYWAVGYKPPVVSTGSPYVANKIGAYDALFHYHNEAFADWANSMGSMVFMGNLAVTQSNSTWINYYWEIYSIMGDPTLTPFMGVPLVNNASYAPTLQVGIGTMQIQAEPYSYVAISQNNILHGTGLADASGNLNLTFTPFTNPGTARLVITRSLRQPLMADIQVTTSTGPYLVLNALNVNDGNNSTAEAGETVYLDLIVNNVGTQTANNITATLTSTSPYVNILDGTSTFTNLTVNTPVNVTSAFQVSIAASVPDQQTVDFTITFTDNNNNTWTAERSLTINSPDVVIGSTVFTDPNNNGSFEPGETIAVNFNLTNNGHMNALAGELAVIINSAFASTTQTTFTLPAINIGVSLPLTIQVTIAANAQIGTAIPIGLAFTAGNQLVNGMISLPVGTFMEDFEPTFDPTLPWVNDNAAPWTIVSGTGIPHSGVNACKTGAISNNGSTEFKITLNITSAGNITYWRRVSSEPGYDFFSFSIDEAEQGTWSGNQPWALQTSAVTVGTHTFKWAYSKDANTTGGSDCAWIDDITFPIFANNNVPLFYLQTTALDFSAVLLNTLVTKNLVVRNLGGAALAGTVTVPALVSLSFNGNAVTDTYNYSIPAGGNGIFTIGVLLTSPTNVTDNIVFTSNDTGNPTQQVALTITSSANDDNHDVPLVNNLEGNFPNPFNPVTTIRFAVKETGSVAIQIFNTKGQLVRTLANNSMKAGNYSLVWNGNDDNGKQVSSGVYVYRMQTKGFAQTKKMMMMK